MPLVASSETSSLSHDSYSHMVHSSLMRNGHARNNTLWTVVLPLVMCMCGACTIYSSYLSLLTPSKQVWGIKVFTMIGSVSSPSILLNMWCCLWNKNSMSFLFLFYSILYFVNHNLFCVWFFSFYFIRIFKLIYVKLWFVKHKAKHTKVSLFYFLFFYFYKIEFIL